MGELSEFGCLEEQERDGKCLELDKDRVRCRSLAMLTRELVTWCDVIMSVLSSTCEKLQNIKLNNRCATSQPFNIPLCCGEGNGKGQPHDMPI